MRKKQDPFVEIRPYNTEEIPYAINRMLMSSNFVTSLTNFIETSNPSTLVRRMRKMKTISDHYGIRWIQLHDIDKQWGHPSQLGMRQIADQLTQIIQ